MRNGHGGGIAFYVRRDVKVRKLLHPENMNIEQMWHKLNINTVTIAIGTAYRPRWVDVNTFFEALTDSISSFLNCDHIILLGDFNINVLAPSEYNTKQLSEFLEQTGLTQLVNSATHFTETSETLIDLVCSNLKSRRLEIQKIGSSIRGHALISCEFVIKKPKPKLFLTDR